MSSLHARFAGLTLVLLLLWGITSVRIRQRAADLIPTVQIAVEHTEPVGITLTRTTNGLGPVDIRNDADQTIHISLPEQWTRDEVKDAPVSWIKSEAPSLGFKRWAIPTHATVTFLGAGEWNKLSVKNVSDVPLRLRVVNIDISAGTSTTDSYLIKDQTLLVFNQ